MWTHFTLLALSVLYYISMCQSHMLNYAVTHGYFQN